MFILSLVWLGIGLLIGALALGARLRPIAWGRRGWLVMLALGAVAALLGGWLGALLWGRLYGTPTALWVAALVVALGPWMFTRLRARA